MPIDDFKKKVHFFSPLLQTIDGRRKKDDDSADLLVKGVMEKNSIILPKFRCTKF